MRVAMISCEAYRDAWEPFLKLLTRFWPGQIVDVISDRHGESWCESLSDYARRADEPVLLLQEDFLLTSPVQNHLIGHGLKQLQDLDAGCVRLYPCPGGTLDYGDPYFALVERNADYRISCQAAIWNPRFLYDIASHFKTPSEFETVGTEFSRIMEPNIIAFKRDVTPWPMEYLCSAIGRGLWSQDAKKLCDKYGIDVDWSRRGFQEA